MDFNYLYHRRQVSIMRAGAAACDKSCEAHQGLADGYDRQIAAARLSWGASAMPLPLEAGVG